METLSPNLASFPTNQPLETVVRKNGETPGVKCRNVMNLYESRTSWTFINAKPVPFEYIICSHLDILQRPFFPSLRQIESKLGLRDRGNMDIQNCLNHSILISNLAPMATILIFFSKGIALQTIHVCQVILKLVGRNGANMGIETF